MREVDGAFPHTQGAVRIVLAPYFRRSASRPVAGARAVCAARTSLGMHFRLSRCARRRHMRRMNRAHRISIEREILDFARLWLFFSQFRAASLVAPWSDRTRLPSGRIRSLDADGPSIQATKRGPNSSKISLGDFTDDRRVGCVGAVEQLSTLPFEPSPNTLDIVVHKQDHCVAPCMHNARPSRKGTAL
jgi:hypothetical protein